MDVYSGRRPPKNRCGKPGADCDDQDMLEGNESTALALAVAAVGVAGGVGGGGGVVVVVVGGGGCSWGCSCSS